MSSLGKVPWRGADLKAPLAFALAVLAFAAWKASYSTGCPEGQHSPPSPASCDEGSPPSPTGSSTAGGSRGHDGGRPAATSDSSGNNDSTGTQSHTGRGSSSSSSSSNNSRRRRGGGTCQCGCHIGGGGVGVVSGDSTAAVAGGGEGGDNNEKGKEGQHGISAGDVPGAGVAANLSADNNNGAGTGLTGGTDHRNRDDHSCDCCTTAAVSVDGGRTHQRRVSDGSSKSSTNGTSHTHRKRGSRSQGSHYTGRSKVRDRVGTGGGLGRAAAATAAASAAGYNTTGASTVADAKRGEGVAEKTEKAEKVVEAGTTVDSALAIRRMCRLPGVVLRSGLVYQRVTALTLQRQGIVDADIPANVGRLAGMLRRVDLSGNKLLEVPRGLLELGGVLEELNLGNNQILELPAEISNLAGLLSLNMAGNRLSSLPSEVGQLPLLKRLGLKGNALVKLPASLGDLSHLVELYLTKNNLEALPDEIVKLRKLRKLQLSFNKLRSLPAGMEAMRSLELCRLAMNPDLAIVPEGLAYAERLSWISLAGSAWCARATAKRRRDSFPDIARDDLELLDKLGSGASGEVFAGIYQGRDVAVKVFKAEIGPDGSSRDELDVACVLDHPNLTKAIGMVHEEGARQWLVMEKVAGRPLAEKPDFTSVLRCRWGQGRRFEPVLVLAVLLQVARAMSYLHEKGICHGDLYAHNVLVDGETGATVLCDFGASFFYPSDRHKQQSFALEGTEVRAFGLMARDMARRSAGCQWILKDLVPTCLQSDAGCRPSFYEIVNQLHAELMQSVEPSSPMVTSAKSLHSLLDRPDIAAESGRQRSAERRKEISSSAFPPSSSSSSSSFSRPGTVLANVPPRSVSEPGISTTSSLLNSSSNGVTCATEKEHHENTTTTITTATTATTTTLPSSGLMKPITKTSYSKRGIDGRLGPIVLGGVVEETADDEGGVGDDESACDTGGRDEGTAERRVVEE